MTEDALVGRLRENYGGYSFEPEAQAHVFSPWSVLNFLRHPGQGFKNYWFASGGLPTRFLELPGKHALMSPDQFNQPIGITLDELSASRNVYDLSVTALLVQAGYLTIKTLKSSKAPTNYFTPNILRKSWSRLVVSVVHLDALAFPVAAT